MMTHFLERQRVHPALTGLLLFAALTEAVLALSWHGPLIIHIVMGIAAAVFALFAILLRELTIRVNVKAAVFGFGPLKQTIYLSDIANVRIIDTGALMVGVGIHRTQGNLTAWIARPGSAIEIHVHSSGSVKRDGYIVSTGRPHALADALQSGQTSRAIEEAPR